MKTYTVIGHFKSHDQLSVTPINANSILEAAARKVEEVLEVNGWYFEEGQDWRDNPFFQVDYIFNGTDLAYQRTDSQNPEFIW